MKEIIGIDIDGVLTDEGTGKNNIWYNAMKKYFNRDLQLQQKTFNFKKAYGLTEEELQAFLEDHLEEIYSGVAPAPGAAEVLKRLEGDGVKIILMTARHAEFRKLTENWLQKHNFVYHKLYHEDDKASLALKLNIELFIEDNEDNARELIEAGIPVILVDKYHNQSISDSPDIFRTNHNWQQIETLIKNIMKIQSKSEITNTGC